MSQWVLTAFLQAACITHETTVIEPVGRDKPGDLRLALCQRAGFIHHHGVHLLHTLQGFRIANQNATLSTASDTHHDGHGRRQAKCARAGNDQNTDRCNQPERHRRRGPEE